MDSMALFTASISPSHMRSGRIQWEPPSMQMPPPVIALL